MRVLIVEDEMVSRTLLESILKPLVEYDTATNGEEAYLKFQDGMEQDRPFDLIFLDIMMPEVDGHEALVAIREYEKLAQVENPVKVIMTTALDDGMSIYDAHLNGCEDYIVKPISKNKLLDVMTKWGLLGNVVQ